MSFTSIRNVHVKGHVVISTDQAGVSNKFLTCGTEGAVYIWDEKTVNERESIDIKSVADSTHSCLAWHGKNVFVGMTTTDLLTGIDKKILGQCSIDDLESCRQLFTFSLEVTAVDASENYVVAGGSDFTVKKVNLKNHGQYDRIDTNGEVICVAIDPKEEIFAVACSDGTVSIYNLEGNEKLASLEFMFTAFGDFNVESPRHTLTWSKDGSELFVPSQGCVKAIKRDNWTLATESFKSNGTATDTYSSSCISKCGRFLCASTLTNKIEVWRVGGRVAVAHYDYKRKDKKTTVSCVKFSPFNDNDVLVVDVDEGFCVLKNAIPSSATKFGLSQESSKILDSKENRSDSSSDKDDDEDDEIRTISKGAFLDDEAEDDGDTRMSADIGEIKRKYGFGDDTTGKLEDFGFTVSDEPPLKDGGSLGNVESITSHIAPLTSEVIAYKPPSIPSFFVSGASPDHLTQRYLKWNTYGIVRTYSGEDGSSVEISFHDVSIHPTIVIDNGTTEYVLADLSDQAVALASKAEEKGEQSELLVIHISSWDSESRRWSTKLPLKENALDVLVSKELICLVTDKQYLRVFSLTGTQRHIISHPSPILTTACFGNFIAICSITGGDYYVKGKDHQPHFQHTVSIYDVDSRNWYRKKSTVTTVNVPVAKKDNLLWLSYTNCGQLVSMDSSYTIRLLSPSGFWLPIFDGSAETSGKSDAIWPIAVAEGRQKQIRYLYCKGSKHPLIAVKMAPLIAPWTMPYCVPDSDKSKLEQDLFLNELRQSEVISTGSSSEVMELASGHLQSLVKLFALACKSERDGRAAELAGLVASAKGIQMMCNYAAKLKKSTLADKVAAKGRENVSSNDSASTSHEIVHEDPAPRRVLMKRKSEMAQQQPLFMEDDSVTSNMSGRCSDEEVEFSQQQNSSFSQASDSMLNDSTVVPMPKTSRNPFKRSPSFSQDTPSVFHADSSFSAMNRKRNREEETPKPSSTKQIKLSFGSGSGKNKENARTAYSLWMDNEEENLRKMFSGNPDDFLKFCAQKFRMLPPAEKKEWKSRAESGTCQ